MFNVQYSTAITYDTSTSNSTGAQTMGLLLKNISGQYSLSIISSVTALNLNTVPTIEIIASYESNEWIECLAIKYRKVSIFLCTSSFRAHFVRIFKISQWVLIHTVLILKLKVYYVFVATEKKCARVFFTKQTSLYPSTKTTTMLFHRSKTCKRFIL